MGLKEIETMAEVGKSDNLEQQVYTEQIQEQKQVQEDNDYVEGIGRTAIQDDTPT